MQTNHITFGLFEIANSLTLNFWPNFMCITLKY